MRRTSSRQSPVISRQSRRRALVPVAVLVLVAVCTLGQAPRAQSADSALVLYAAVGSELTTYAVHPSDVTLTKASSVTLPFAVQYAWPHPSKRFLYVAWSNGMQGDRHGITAYQ